MFCFLAVLMLGGNPPQDAQPAWHATLNPALVLAEAPRAEGPDDLAAGPQALPAGDASALRPSGLAPARVKGQRCAAARGVRRAGSRKMAR